MFWQKTGWRSQAVYTDYTNKPLIHICDVYCEACVFSDGLKMTNLHFFPKKGVHVT
jgi:hypothetical protein